MSKLKNMVLELLKSYPHMKRRIAQLRFELEHPTLIEGEELIDSLSLGSLAHENGGLKGGYISDKTMMIALNYPDIAQKMNSDTIVQITRELRGLETKVNRLEHYLSLLDRQQADILRCYYLERRTWSELEDELHMSRSSLQTYRNDALEELSRMYGFILNVREKQGEA